MVWRVASRFASLAADSLPSHRAPFMRCLMALPGCLLRHLSGDRKAIADLR